MQIWDKLANESKNSFEIFTLFRDNKEYRNIDILSNITKKSKKSIENMSVKYNWETRLEQFNFYIQNNQINISDNSKIGELKQTIDKLQITLQGKINEQFAGIESAKIDDIIKLIGNLNKLAIEMEKSTTTNDSNSFDEFIDKIRNNDTAMTAFFDFLRTVEL